VYPEIHCESLDTQRLCVSRDSQCISGYTEITHRENFYLCVSSVSRDSVYLEIQR